MIMTFFFVIDNERKKDWMKERKLGWFARSMEQRFLERNYSCCICVDLGCTVFLGNKFLFTKSWWCSRLWSYTMYDLWGWVCEFPGFAGTVRTNDTNSQPPPTVWWIWGSPAANLYWLDNVNQAAVLFVCCRSFLLSNIELERQAELCCVYDMTSVQVPDEAVCTSLLQIVLFGDRVILSDPIEMWALQIAMLSSVQFPDHVQFFFGWGYWIWFCDNVHQLCWNFSIPKCGHMHVVSFRYSHKFFLPGESRRLVCSLTLNWMKHFVLCAGGQFVIAWLHSVHQAIHLQRWKLTLISESSFFSLLSLSLSLSLFLFFLSPLPPIKINGSVHAHSIIGL